MDDAEPMSSGQWQLHPYISILWSAYAILQPTQCMLDKQCNRKKKNSSFATSGRCDFNWNELSVFFSLPIPTVLIRVFLNPIMSECISSTAWNMNVWDMFSNVECITYSLCVQIQKHRKHTIMSSCQEFQQLEFVSSPVLKLTYTCCKSQITSLSLNADSIRMRCKKAIETT